MKSPIKRRPGYWNCWNRAARLDEPVRRPYQNIARIDRRRYRRMYRREARSNVTLSGRFERFSLNEARNYKR